MRISYSEQELIDNLKNDIAAAGVDTTALLAEFNANKEAIGSDDLLWRLYCIRCDAKRLAFEVFDDKAWVEFLKSRTRLQ